MNNRSTTILLRSFGALMLLLLVACHPSRRAIAVEEGWDILAQEKVNFVRDKDEIPVRSRSQYTAIRFKVEDRDIHINDLKIYFTNGDKLEPNINDDIKAGEFSRVIEVAAEGRYIDHIEFTYRTTGNILKGRANVILFGRRYYRGY